MGFFDLNIPYENSPSSKKTRIKLVIKAMELGYVGVAYNRTMKGIMSDDDRCSIPLLSLSSILKVAPSVASSVNFHRGLLGVPRDSPFRQYTRLTVCVDTPAQSQVLNSGNPILKTYDLVAVRPLNQIAFDHACEKSEVDVIAINFSEKLPFRLKLPMVKAATERGVCFEITYADLIVDVQVRRQMISSAKLLVDWTGGKNLIFSSDAPSASEIRGPYDVVNLASLLGLSMERAKAAISKNCRNLITNSLRKKNFYKEAIRVERILSVEKSGSDNPLSADWLKWDPISSGEGDLQLDDMAKSFSAITGACKTVKAIDFTSIVDSISQTATKAIEVTVANIGVSGKPGGPDLDPGKDRTSLYTTILKNQTFCYESSQELHLPSDATDAATNLEDTRTPTNTVDEPPNNLNDSELLYPLIRTERHDLQSQECIPSCGLDVLVPNENLIHQTSAMHIELNAACVADAGINTSSENISPLTPQIETSTSSQGFDIDIGANNFVMDEQRNKIDIEGQDLISFPEIVLDKQIGKCGDDTITLVDQFPFPVTSDDVEVKDPYAVANQETLEEVAMEEQEHVDTNTDAILVPDNDLETKDNSLVANLKTLDEVTMEEQEHADANAESILVLDDNLEGTNGSSVANCVPPEEMTMREQKLDQADTKSNYATLVASLSGKPSTKQRRLHGPLLFPSKRLLNPWIFKRKAKKFKRRMKAC